MCRPRPSDADLQIKFHSVNLLSLPDAAKREKVDDFYPARTANRAALPWSSFAPPFSLTLADTKSLNAPPRRTVIVVVGDVTGGDHRRLTLRALLGELGFR
jgi:hypothetical protein